MSSQVKLRYQLAIFARQEASDCVPNGMLYFVGYSSGVAGLRVANYRLRIILGADLS
uniref:Uncharacterized protein n=1 Tax=Rhizophora mucronata TaxID=61149 RepID=A0A2P2J2I9_RHIMU